MIWEKISPKSFWHGGRDTKFSMAARLVGEDGFWRENNPKS